MIAGRGSALSMGTTFECYVLGSLEDHAGWYTVKVSLDHLRCPMHLLSLHTYTRDSRFRRSRSGLQPKGMKVGPDR
jgi:hypothetical protein